MKECAYMRKYIYVLSFTHLVSDTVKFSLRVCVDIAGTTQ